MGTAKPVALNVRASQASHLCFETGGILGELETELGAKAYGFDFAKFHATLGSLPTVPSHPARLLYDFLQIQAFTTKFTLASLRAETNKTTLNRAINSRANAFYAKYANAPAIIAKMNTMYSPSISGSKPNRLDILASISETQMLQLRSAYLADGRTSVVRNTESTLHSMLSTSGSATTTGLSDEKDVSMAVSPGTFLAPPAAGLASITVAGSRPVEEAVHMGIEDQHTTSSSEATDDQTIVNTDYGYRIPFLENLAQYERAQISLIDEQFGQFMYGQNLPYLAAVFANELMVIDSDVFRTQIAYLNTILMSPIEGIVTGIYKNPGDAVRAGEPVVRVENNATVLLLATLVYRGPIAIGATLDVSTQLFDAAGPPTSISGPIVSVRGQLEDDHWEVIAKCNNLDGAGKPILPLGYHFDFDDTTVTIT
ncbi:MAG: hypothetical protein DMF87_04835 [Acidobacteria bacterium]|nr:MAG: hypothetical protein DMF87_04835 [Acidobacteriota bacterium]